MTGAMFDDETLMRYADGELDAETAARIDAALESDERLAERLALFIDTRAGAQAAMRPLLDEPVPAALAASVQAMIDAKRAEREETPTVVPFRAPPRENPPARGRASMGWLMPLAASVAAVLGGVVGFGLAERDAAQPTGLVVAGISSPKVTAALAEVVSGEERELEPNGRRFRAIATFRDPRGALCREFEVDSPDRSTVISVACREAHDWNVAFAVVAPAADDAGYAPASSTETLDAYLGAIGAGAPLEGAQEADALRAIQTAE